LDSFCPSDLATILGNMNRKQVISGARTSVRFTVKTAGLRLHMPMKNLTKTGPKLDQKTTFNFELSLVYHNYLQKPATKSGRFSKSSHVVSLNFTWLTLINPKQKDVTPCE
jgi:hypothetical protein